MAAQRKSTDERLETLRHKQDAIRAQLASLEARKRTEQQRRETRRKFIVGAAALVQADADPAFREALRTALQSAVTRNVDRAIIADLLGIEAPVAPVVDQPQSEAA